MVCRNWSSEDSYCVIRKKTINYEDLNFCAETCEQYKPSQPKSVNKQKTIVCKNCNAEFTPTQSGKVEIKNREYFKCPKCGSINLRRDDEVLSF